MSEVIRWQRRDDGVMVVTIDDPSAEVNTLRAELADEFSALLDELSARSDVMGLVLHSGKPEGFIAGADLDMLNAVTSAEEGARLSRLSQQIQARIASAPFPSVAAIHGAALGGGLELALAFTARIASDHEQTRLGLPEVQLGLLPGGGGTQRLAPLVGLTRALDMLLTGRQINARRARAAGLVDRIVTREVLLSEAIELVHALSGRDAAAQRRVLNRPLAPFKPLWWRELLIARNPIGRRIVFAQTRARTRARTRGHYPAPERIIDVVEAGFSRGRSAGLAAEALAFGELTMTAVARRLIGLFFATTALKKDPGVDADDVEPYAVSRVAMVGAGLMGAGIAHVSARHAKVDVVLKDRDEKSALGGKAHIADALDGSVKRRSLSRRDREAILSRIEPATDYASVADADVVIEAVFEDLALKREILDQVQSVTRDDAVFASNTSSLPIAEIAALCARPQNVLGMHYFSPVERMPLLEIVRGERTADRAVATCVALGKRQNKTVIVVRDGPGFYTSRVLAPYINEAAWLLSEGVAVDRIDRALVDFGFPVGPLALLDEVGIDVGSKVAGVMAHHFGGRMQVPDGMQALADDNRLGRKNARGFYRYDRRVRGARPVDESVYALLGVTPNNGLPAAEIAERCVLQMVNEAALCLDEGILRNPRDGDVGAVFGLGFPPFLGGPLRYADDLGAAQVVARLEHYRDLTGDHTGASDGASAAERFEPAARLRQMASAGRRFHR